MVQMCWSSSRSREGGSTSPYSARCVLATAALLPDIPPQITRTVQQHIDEECLRATLRVQHGYALHTDILNHDYMSCYLCTMYIVKCLMYIVKCLMYVVKCLMYVVKCLMYVVKFTLCLYCSSLVYFTIYVDMVCFTMHSTFNQIHIIYNNITYSHAVSNYISVCSYALASLLRRWYIAIGRV